MPSGMRGSRDFFKERFGLGDRLAVRLAALLARKVDVSAAAIECLKDSPALQHAVLHPNLLERAEQLDTDQLRSLVLPGEALPAQLIVVEREGWRTIALEEELLAEQGAEGEGSGDQLPVLGGKGAVLHPSEIAELFSRRDIAELELTLRTSADANEKITAIRRLALSPAGESEKLALFALALTDRDAQVRGEAAEALTSLGLAPEVADDARALAEGNPRQKHTAAQRLGSRIRQAESLEMGVLLRIIAGTLRHEPALDTRRLLIRAVEGACQAVAADPRSTRDLVRVLLAQLRDAVEELGPEVRRVLLILGRFCPHDVYGLLQDELESVADPASRSLLLAVAGELAASKEQRADVCGQAVAQILASDDPAVQCLPLANVLGQFGEQAVAAIEPRLLEAPEAAQEALVRLLDVLATRPKTPKATRARIGGLLLAALQRGERSARLAVIQSTATMDPAVRVATRRALATELLGCLQEYANPGILDAIETTVVRLGHPAVEPVVELLGAEGRPRPRVSAARILGLVVRRLGPGRGAMARRAIDRAVALLDGDFPDRGALARALGEACAGPAADEPTVARVAALPRARVLDKPLAHAALAGLASLCLSPHAAAALKVDLASFFSRLLERDLPEIEAKSLEGDDETVYAMGGEVTTYTELVPSAIAGLSHIAACSSGTLRQQALDALLHTWRRIADGDLQLGPGNTERLLDALHAIGTRDDMGDEAREAIAEAVALRGDFMPTCRVLAELCVAAGGALAPRAARLADELLEREASARQLTEDERATLLGALVRLATAAELGPEAGRLRERIVGAVVDADKRELEAASDLIAQLHDAPAISAELKKRLATRRGAGL